MSKQKLGFAENFALSGAAAVISKTAAAPIERVKLLVQNQDEMIKAGRLSEPYKGVIDCTLRTYRTEGKILMYSVMNDFIRVCVYVMDVVFVAQKILTILPNHIRNVLLNEAHVC